MAKRSKPSQGGAVGLDLVREGLAHEERIGRAAFQEAWDFADWLLAHTILRSMGDPLGENQVYIEDYAKESRYTLQYLRKLSKTAEKYPPNKRPEGLAVNQARTCRTLEDVKHHNRRRYVHDGTTAITNKASTDEKSQIAVALVKDDAVARAVQKALDKQRRVIEDEEEPEIVHAEVIEDEEEPDEEVMEEDEEVTPPPAAKTKPAKPKAVKEPPPEPSPLEEALEDTEESLKRLRILLDRHSDDEREEVFLKTQAKLKRFDIDIAHMAQTVKARLKKQRSHLRSVK